MQYNREMIDVPSSEDKKLLSPTLFPIAVVRDNNDIISTMEVAQGTTHVAVIGATAVGILPASESLRSQKFLAQGRGGDRDGRQMSTSCSRSSRGVCSWRREVYGIDAKSTRKPPSAWNLKMRGVSILQWQLKHLEGGGFTSRMQRASWMRIKRCEVLCRLNAVCSVVQADHPILDIRASTGKPVPSLAAFTRMALDRITPSNSFA